MSDWQPIETAPKDGTDVLLHIDGRPPIVAGWFHERWVNFDDIDAFIHPTHWMPLPEQPADRRMEAESDE